MDDKGVVSKCHFSAASWFKIIFWKGEGRKQRQWMDWCMVLWCGMFLDHFLGTVEGMSRGDEWCEECMNKPELCHTWEELWWGYKGNKTKCSWPFPICTAETSRMQVHSKGNGAWLRDTVLTCTDKNLAQIWKVEPIQPFICSQGQILLVLVF